MTAEAEVHQRACQFVPKSLIDRDFNAEYTEYTEQKSEVRLLRIGTLSVYSVCSVVTP